MATTLQTRTRHPSVKKADGVSPSALRRELQRLRVILTRIDPKAVVPKRTGRSDSLRARKDRTRKEIEDVARAIENARRRKRAAEKKRASEAAKKRAVRKPAKKRVKKPVKKRAKKSSASTAPATPTAPAAPVRKPPGVPRPPQIIALPKEILEAKVLRYHARLKRTRRIKSPNRGHSFDASWRVNVPGRRGSLRNRRIQRLLNEGSLESILRKIERDLRSVASRTPGGELFVSFSLYEYGSQIVGSPGEKFFSDGQGDFYNTFEATRGSSSVQGASIQARGLLEQMLSHPQSAALLDSYTVKSYIFR